MKKAYLILFSIVLMQHSQDARMLGLGGAYTTLSNGYRAVGINPANINIGTKGTVNAFSSYSSFSNNFFNINRYNDLNGSHMDNPLAPSYYPKQNIKNTLGDQGVRFNTNSVLAIPGLNFSKDNYAFTSNLIFYGDVEFPEAFVDIMFFGNEVGEDLNMSFDQNMLSSIETAFTYSQKFPDVSIGLSLKYLQGIYYSNMESFGDSYFRTDADAFSGSGNYLIKQGLGGSGFAIDFGATTTEFDNGMRFGVSLINAFSSMTWNKDTPLRKTLQSIGVEFPVREKEYFFFRYGVNDLNIETLMNSAESDIFNTENYKVCVIDFSDIPIINPSEIDELPPFYIDESDIDNIQSDDNVINPNQIVILDDGRVAIPTDNLSDSDLNFFKSRPFKTDYPIFLRFGMSKNFSDEDIVIATDIMTSLNDMFGNEEKWKLAVGAEINKIPKIPVRFGMTFGGKDRLRFGLGSGYSFGKVKIDVAFGYIGSFKMANTRGLDLGLNVFYDYKKSDEANSTFIDKIKQYLVGFLSKKDKIELEVAE